MVRVFKSLNLRRTDFIEIVTRKTINKTYNEEEILLLICSVQLYLMIAEYVQVQIKILPLF